MQVKVIKKEDLANIAATAPAFDREMCLAEARNAERLMRFYMSRCDEADVADELAGIFERLAEMCRNRGLSLRKRMG